MTDVRCVVTGDKSVGKRTLYRTYLTKHFPTDIYTYSFGINYKSVNIQVDEEPVNLHLDGVIGMEDYGRLRPLFYLTSNVALLAFSIVDPATLKNCATIWYPELKSFSPDVPIILVGTKKDLRDGFTKDSVPFSEGLKVSGDIEAVAYLECSSVTGEGLNEVFQEAARVGLDYINKKKRKRPCSIL